jgi:hypothetical protein
VGFFVAPDDFGEEDPAFCATRGSQMSSNSL